MVICRCFIWRHSTITKYYFLKMSCKYAHFVFLLIDRSTKFRQSYNHNYYIDISGLPGLLLFHYLKVWAIIYILWKFQISSCNSLFSRVILKLAHLCMEKKTISIPLIPTIFFWDRPPFVLCTFLCTCGTELGTEALLLLG